jgi:hypothetical protein
MKKPKRASCNLRRGTINLHFEDHNDSREFFSKGSIWWPKAEEGYALLGALEIATDKIWILSEHAFLTVDDHLENYVVKYHGLGPWLNKCWSRYYTKKFYWAQAQTTADRFRLPTYRSLMIEPKPQLIEIDLHKDEERPLIASFIRTERLTLAEDFELAKELEQLRVGEDGDLSPGVRALARLLAAYTKFPFNQGHVEEDIF